MTENFPLHTAVCENDLELVDALLKKGADVNVQNSEGDTPLYIATQKGYNKIVRLLFANHARVIPTETFLAMINTKRCQWD